MEPVRTWGPTQVTAWLRGLDAAVQGYPFHTWGLSGPDLLGLDAGALEALGVRPLGHQELLLEATEQLRHLDTGLASTSLRTLTERLQELAQGVQSLAQGGLSAGDAPQPPSLTLLARVIDLVGAAKELFSWLNRYLFSTLNDFSASRDIVLLCAQLAETLQADLPAAERNVGVLQICRHIAGICQSIVGCSPPALLDRRAVLQRVVLALPPGPRGSPPMSPSTPPLPLGLRKSPPTSPEAPTLPPSRWSSPPGSPETPRATSDLLGGPRPLLSARLGFEITSTSSCLHFVSATAAEALAAHGGHVLPGDEIVQVNEQVVVGWTPASLERKLLETGSRVTLVLKKIPLDLPSSPPSPRQQPPGAFLDAADSPGTRSGESPGSPVSLTSSVAADLDSGPDSAPDPVTDEELEEDERDLRLPGEAVEELPRLSGAEEELPRLPGAVEVLPGLSGAVEELPRLSGAVEVLPRLPGEAEEELPRLSGEAVEELPRLSGEAEEELPRLPGVAVEELPRLSGEAEEELPRLPGVAVEELPRLSGEAEEELPRLPGVAVEELPRLPGEAEEELPRLPGVAVEELPRLSGEAVEELPRLSGAEEELPRLSGAVEELPRLSGAEEELPRLSGAVEELPRLSRVAVEELPRLPGAEEELPRLSGAVEELPRLSGAEEELPRLSGQGAAEAWDSGTPLETPLDTPPSPSPSAPAATEPCATELSPRAAPTAGAGGAEPSQLPGEGSPGTGRRQKGVATRLSRRRVSCRDLGRVDCDGWLLKKKDHASFMAQKWKRCWFVLKGHTLYWYNHPNDERAAGLINVATYDLESTREQKKKYVFQLCHQKYKPFVFAAETLADLSMWVSRLVTAKTKYTLAQQAVPDKEEDCYSETEAEDPDDETPRHGSDAPRRRLQHTPEKLSPASSTASSPQGSPRPCSPVDPAEEDLESLMLCLRQGGVSLLGQRRSLTQEQCRKSFLRRNKNPHINERVHAVRALQSTLKAKLAELQALEQLLGEAALTSDTFRRWKEEHQELYQELREGWAGQRGRGHAGDQHSPHQEAAEP